MIKQYEHTFLFLTLDYNNAGRCSRPMQPWHSVLWTLQPIILHSAFSGSSSELIILTVSPSFLFRLLSPHVWTAMPCRQDYQLDQSDLSKWSRFQQQSLTNQPGHTSHLCSVSFSLSVQLLPPLT